jgi:hypothetical protein
MNMHSQRFFLEWQMAAPLRADLYCKELLKNRNLLEPEKPLEHALPPKAG